MENEKEKAKRCAVEILNKLGYDVDETDPTTVVASTYPLDEQFSVMLDLYHLEFVLKDPSLTKKPDIKRRLDVLNRHLQLCLKGDKS